MLILWFVNGAATAEQLKSAAALRCDRHKVHFRSAPHFRADEMERCERIIVRSDMNNVIAAYRGCGIEIDLEKPNSLKSVVAAEHDDVLTALEVMEDEPDAWTDAGLPKTSRLSALVGRTVSADDRNAAWLHYQALRARNGSHA